MSGSFVFSMVAARSSHHIEDLNGLSTGSTLTNRPSELNHIRASANDHPTGKKPYSMHERWDDCLRQWGLSLCDRFRIGPRQQLTESMKVLWSEHFKEVSSHISSGGWREVCC
jgi:hypothetical protein